MARPAPRSASSRSASAAGWLFLLAAVAGCTTVVTDVERGRPIGPTIVLDVANASGEEHQVGYEFTADGGAGEGSGAAGPCERLAQPYGEVTGAYAIHVDGESIFEAHVSQDAPSDRFLVVRIAIAPDGTATVIVPGLLAEAPDPEPRPIPGCS
jgi:hypothetical protein